MANFDDFDIRAEIGPLLRRCDRRSLDLYESSVGSGAPTRQQCGVLLAIHQLKTPTQVQIAQRSGIDRSTVGGIVRRLAAKGLVKLKPSPSDNRAVTHALTKKGFTVLNQSMEVLIDTQEKLVAFIPPHMRPSFVKCLQLIANYDLTRGEEEQREVDEVPLRPTRRRRRNSD